RRTARRCRRRRRRGSRLRCRCRRCGQGIAARSGGAAWGAGHNANNPGLSRRTPMKAATSIVLVHGAWHGAWCWRRVLPLLRAAGAEAHAVTLNGLGERAHLMGPQITLQTHVQDVLGLIEAEELQRVLLVGHSYSGMVVTGAADRLQAAAPGVLAQLVYVD